MLREEKVSVSMWQRRGLIVYPAQIHLPSSREVLLAPNPIAIRMAKQQDS